MRTPREIFTRIGNPVLAYTQEHKNTPEFVGGAIVALFIVAGVLGFLLGGWLL